MRIKTRLITALSLILLSVFLVTSLLNYAVTREAVRKELLQSTLPLTGENIYSEIHSAIMRPILVSSAMANDTFLKDWVMDGEQDLDRLTKYLREIEQRYGFLSAFFVSARTDNYYTPDGILKKIGPRDPHDIWYYAFVRYKKPYDLDVDSNQDAGDQLTIFVNFRLEDDQGHLLGVTGVGISIDRAAQKLAEAESKFSRLAYMVDQDGLIQVHPDLTLVENKYIAEMDGLSAIAKKVLTPRESTANFEYDSNGRHYLLTTRYIKEFDWHLLVVQDEEDALKAARDNFIRTLIIGFVSSIIILFLCIVTVNHFQARLERMAKTDPLTGAANRRELESRFTLSAYRHSRTGEQFSIIIIDLDKFKAINDRFGHLEGDRVLESVANVIKNTIRTNDLLARWGGDEFIVLVEGGLAHAQGVAARIHEAVTLSQDISICFSSGVAEFQTGDDIISLTQRADAAMYAAKAKGGDCTVTA